MTTLLDRVRCIMILGGGVVVWVRDVGRGNQVGSPNPQPDIGFFFENCNIGGVRERNSSPRRTPKSVLTPPRRPSLSSPSPISPTASAPPSTSSSSHEDTPSANSPP
mmetsp:Transcript_39379/g.84032  ORF Transcript_39379/g.84032 Transcript_39379/m.84032 type:complete len:107 (-) Transcript_39379:840-1160(-)